MSNLFTQVSDAIIKIGHGWTSEIKGHALAAAVMAIRPEISLEIGVFAGKGTISLALAHKFIAKGTVIGIDPYSPAESVKGQVSETDKKWWQELDHEAIYKMAQSNILTFGVQNVCKLHRQRSDDFKPPYRIGVLVVDGNHGEQSIIDFQRYAPAVQLGGFLFADDLNWSGDSVKKAVSLLPGMGFEKIFQYEKGGESWACYQRSQL